MIRITVNGKDHHSEAGQELGVFLRTLSAEGTSERGGIGAGLSFACGGHGRCGKCKVKASGALSPVTAAEERCLGETGLAEGYRLACQVKALGDCEISTGEPPRDRNGCVAIEGEMAEFELSPSFSGYGVAVDIGTTTIAAKLFDDEGNELSSYGMQNPQGRWGADVISRMEAALKGEAENLAEAVRGAVNESIDRVAVLAGINEKAPVRSVVITGNTVMLYLLCGIDTEPLTHAPFEAKELFGRSFPAASIGLTAAPDAVIYIPPCIAAFIGADTVCAALAVGLDRPGDTAIMTDIGTNGEMVIRSKKGLYACSTAAGPAFEGAGISMGMGGFEGAVDRVSIGDGDRLTAHVIGEEKGARATGICGSGLIDAVACLLELEAVDETGFMEEDECEIADGVKLIRNDIRAVQLAKSAIHAGILTLMHASGTAVGDVVTLSIAGGFGKFLNIDNAGKIGLIPSALVPRVSAAGNAALSGASMLLLSVPARERALSFSRLVDVVDLSTDPMFSQEFMNQMAFEC